jgi:hypothetical protein
VRLWREVVALALHYLAFPFNAGVIFLCVMSCVCEFRFVEFWGRRCVVSRVVCVSPMWDSFDALFSSFLSA